MNRFGKIAIAVIVLALVVCIYLFWPAITGAINGNKYYTASDVQSAYDKGYDDGVGDKSQYEEVIKAYKEKVQSLNLTIAKNDKTISGLQDSIKTKDAEIDGLEKQIEELSPYKDKADELNALIDKLKKTISEQEKTIEYYENAISSLEDEDTIFVTFEADNSVYSVEKIARGAKVTTIVNPASTEHAKFVGWYLGEELINLDSYTFDNSVKLVAKFERSYTVRFMVDGEVYDTQLVQENSCITCPEEPSKDGYIFKGWSTSGGIIVDKIETVSVNSHLTYVAVFTALHTVKFVYEDAVIDTQSVLDGESATNVDYSVEYREFKGWTVDGVIVDVPNYKISQDTVFTGQFINTSYILITSVNDDFYAVRTNDTIFNWEDKLPIAPSQIQSIEFPNTFTSVSLCDRAEKCSNLTQLILPDSLTEIIDGAFWGCENLESVVIPNGVTEIGLRAFGACTKLHEVYIQSVNLTPSPSYIFSQWEGELIIHYAGTKTQWSNIVTDYTKMFSFKYSKEQYVTIDCVDGDLMVMAYSGKIEIKEV